MSRTQHRRTRARVNTLGTIQHGIGLGKLKYLRHEHGDGAVDAMHAIKRALDPNNILNPGKIGSMIPRL